LANTSAKNPSTGSGIDKPPTSNETEQQSARLEKVIIGSQQPSPKGTELVREIKQDVLTRPPSNR